MKNELRKKELNEKMNYSEDCFESVIDEDTTTLVEYEVEKLAILDITNNNEKFGIEKCRHSWPYSEEDREEENLKSEKDEVQPLSKESAQLKGKIYSENSLKNVTLPNNFPSQLKFFDENKNRNLCQKFDFKCEEDCAEECDEAHISPINSCAQLVRIFPPHSNTSTMQLPPFRRSSENKVEERKREKLYLNFFPVETKRSEKQKNLYFNIKSPYFGFEDLLPQFDDEFQIVSSKRKMPNSSEMVNHMNKIYKKIATQKKLSLLQTSSLHNEFSHKTAFDYIKNSELSAAASRTMYLDSTPGLSTRTQLKMGNAAPAQRLRSKAVLLQNMIAVIDRLGNFILPLAKYYRDPGSSPPSIDFLQKFSHHKIQQIYTEAIQETAKLLNTELQRSLFCLNSAEAPYFDELFPDFYLKDFCRIEDSSLNITRNSLFGFC